MSPFLSVGWAGDRTAPGIVDPHGQYPVYQGFGARVYGSSVFDAVCYTAMRTLVVRSKLDNLTSALELCDEAGVTLGYFVPAADRDRDVYDWARAAFSDEDIEHARQQPGGLTTEELLARLSDR